MPASARPPRPWAFALCSALLLLSVRTTAAQPAVAPDCLRLVCEQGRDDCSIRPARLTARMPAGFAVTSVRGNTSIASRGDAATATCTPAQRLPREISLDQASLYGSVEVAGRLQATGILRFEPNDGGELEFRPDKGTFRGTGAFFQANFARIKLDSAQPPVTIAPPRPLAKADCWQARAAAQLSDFSVLVGDTSAAGTYPRQVRITAVHSFTACTWGGR